jgi:hypothetical protein
MWVVIFALIAFFTGSASGVLGIIAANKARLLNV